MHDNETEPHICYECDAEFVVHTPYELEDPINFCPFCGSEVEGEGTNLDDDDEGEDGDEGDEYDTLVYR